MRRVWLIRHGQSISNANLPTTHPAESELTEQGEAESQQIVGAIPEKPDLIVVSPFLRARQTAVPTIEHFEPVPVEEWPVHEFTYLDPSRYQGTTGEERRPWALTYWKKNDPLHKDQEGESFAEMFERIQDTLARLREQTADFIILFGHGLFLRALLWSALTGTTEATPRTMERYSHFVRAVHFPNAAICKTRVTAAGLIYFSGFDTEHLDR